MGRAGEPIVLNYLVGRSNRRLDDGAGDSFDAARATAAEHPAGGGVCDDEPGLPAISGQGVFRATG